MAKVEAITNYQRPEFGTRPTRVPYLSVVQEKQPTAKERKTVDDIPFEGFPSSIFAIEQKKDRIKQQIEIVGLPIDKVTRVKYAPNPDGQNNLLGEYRPFDGKIKLFKSLEKLPVEVQQGTVIHELAHASSVFDANNQELYKNPEVMPAVAGYVDAFIQQTGATGVYLSGYQKDLMQAFAQGKIDARRLEDETYAIMVEQRFTTPKHLQQVEDAQRQKLAELDNPNIKPINLTSKVTENGQVALSGIDVALINLIPQVNSYEELQAHIEKVRESVRPKGKKPKPLFDQQSLRKAA